MNDYKTHTVPDTLQLNMESISKELSDLIVSSEQEFPISQQYSVSTMKTYSHTFITPVPVKNNFQIPTYNGNNLYGQLEHQVYPTQKSQNVNFNANYCPTVQLPMLSYNCNNGALQKIAPASGLTQRNYLHTEKYISYSSMVLNQACNTNATAAPSYEFHYLRSRENQRKLPGLSNSMGVQGNYRKITKPIPKQFNQKVSTPWPVSEEIKFDLSMLDFLNTKPEKSLVSQLFELLSDLHCAVAETQPSFELDSASQFEETFAAGTKKCSMPSTLNVQNQVRHACRQLIIFTYEMQSILSRNKMLDAELCAECEVYLNQLRLLLHQLETYKRIVMEHKDGKFLREEGKVHAQCLTALLEHTNRQVRIVKGRILAVDWFIGVKYRGDADVTAKQLDLGERKEEMPRKSAIGLVNEILQMCNMREATIKANAVKLEAATTTRSEAAKPDKMLANNNEEVKVNSFLHEQNAGVCNIYKLDQTKRASITTSSHTRQPVFYIG